ncbi:MAG: hypothetical protein WDA70_03625 [Lysobacteraceae bacterium]
MSLKYTAITTFAGTAFASLPTDKPGVYNEGSFTCHFNYLEDADVNTFLDDLQALGGDEQPGKLGKSLGYQYAFVKRILVSVEGIAGESGNLPPETQFDIVLSNQTLWLAALKAFLENRNGAPAKNSKPSQKR